MRYDYEKILSDALMRPVCKATGALVRLDERLKQSPLGPGCLERLHFHDACASLWIDAELVHLEDLVLHDAARDVRSPTHELTIAQSVLRSRRRIARKAPGWALTAKGLAALRGAEDLEQDQKGTVRAEPGAAPPTAAPANAPDDNASFALAEELAAIDAALERSAAVLDGEVPAKQQARSQKAPLVYDPDWGEEDRLGEWRDILRKTEDLPPVLRSVILLDAWNTLDVLERSQWLGRLLAASSLAEAGLTASDHLATINIGLRRIEREKRCSKNTRVRLTALLEAVCAAAEFGLKEHDKLVLAQQSLGQRLKGRRRSSKLPDVLKLVLSRPMVSAGTIAKEVGVSPQAALRLVEELNLRELTGRGRFRVWGVL